MDQLRTVRRQKQHGEHGAICAKQGRELYRQKPTELVITGIIKPELEGLNMLLELTREFLHAKVIAISGVGGEKNVLDIVKLLRARNPSPSRTL